MYGHISDGNTDRQSDRDIRQRQTSTFTSIITLPLTTDRVIVRQSVTNFPPVF